MDKGRRKTYMIIIFFVAAFDLVTKAIVSHTIKYERKELLNGNLSLAIIKNKGAAYNTFSEKPFLVKLLSGTLIGINIVQLFFSTKTAVNKTEQTGLSLLIGGGLGNFIDRLKNGSVTDFVNLKWKKAPVFNLADLFILIGVILYLIGALKE